MAEGVAARFGRVAAGFTAVAEELPAAAWEHPSPCEGWTGRDVVRHLVEWVPAIFTRAGLDLAPATSVDDDPVAAWRELADALQAALDDPAVADHEFDAGPPGRLTVEAAIGMLVVGDVLVHTWDLARAGSRRVTLDPATVADLVAGMEPLDEMLRASGHYGPRVPVADDAPAQDRLLAFMGRVP